MSENLVEAYKPHAAQFEGNVPWMYRDARGHLTIGIGHLLFRKGGSAQALEKAIKSLWKVKVGPRCIRRNGTQALSFVQACTSRKPGPYWKSVQGFISTVDTASGIITAQHDKVFGVLGIELPEEHASDWQAMAQEAEMIMKLPYGQENAGGFYRCYNSYELVTEDIDELFERDVNNIISQIKGLHWVHGVDPSADYKTPDYPEFKNFDSFPEALQIVMIDLGFQLGVAGMANYNGGEFRRLIGEKEWGKAARAVPQPADSQQERNAWRKKQAETGAVEAVKSHNVAAGGGKEEKKVKSTSVEKARVMTDADKRAQGINPAAIEVQKKAVATGAGPAINAIPDYHLKVPTKGTGSGAMAPSNGKPKAAPPAAKAAPKSPPAENK